MVVGGGGGGSDGAITAMSLSIPLHACIELGWKNARESDSRRPRHLGLNVQDGRRPKNAAKTAANYPSSPPPSRPNKARHAQLQLCATNSGDEQKKIFPATKEVEKKAERRVFSLTLRLAEEKHDT